MGIAVSLVYAPTRGAYSSLSVFQTVIARHCGNSHNCKNIACYDIACVDYRFLVENEAGLSGSYISRLEDSNLLLQSGWSHEKFLSRLAEFKSGAGMQRGPGRSNATVRGCGKALEMADGSWLVGYGGALTVAALKHGDESAVGQLGVGQSRLSGLDAEDGAEVESSGRSLGAHSSTAGNQDDHVPAKSKGKGFSKREPAAMSDEVMLRSRVWIISPDSRTALHQDVSYSSGSPNASREG